MVLVDKNSLVIFHAVSGEMIKLNRTAAFPYSVTDKMTSNFQWPLLRLHRAKKICAGSGDITLENLF